MLEFNVINGFDRVWYAHARPNPDDGHVGDVRKRSSDSTSSALVTAPFPRSKRPLALFYYYINFQLLDKAHLLSQTRECCQFTQTTQQN